MRKLLVLLLVVFLSGCIRVRTYEVKKPRVDTDIEGNQGYLTGTPKEEPKESKLGDTRTISVVEIEFGRRKEGDDLQESIISKKEPEAVDIYEFEETALEELELEPGYSEEAAEAETEYEYYTVQKNDTLQKISHRFYGTTRKWQKIYKANKNVIKNPDKVYPGLQLRIPVE